MIVLLLTLAFAQAPKASFSIQEIAFQPEAKLVRVLGPKLRVGRYLQGLYFDNPNYIKVNVDAAGPAMSRLSIRPKWLAPYKVALQRFGIDAAHASVRNLPSPATAIPLQRNAIEVIGAKGVPLSPKSHKPFRVELIECAMVNKDRARELRSSILTASGDAKTKLIRRCYDWYTEINLRL